MICSPIQSSCSTHWLNDPFTVVLELTAHWRERLSVNNVLNLSVAHIKLSCCLNSDYSAQVVWTSNMVLLVLFVGLSKRWFFRLITILILIFKILRLILCSICMCTSQLFKGILHSKMISVTIYSPSCCSKPFWVSFFCNIKEDILRKGSMVFVHTVQVNSNQNFCCQHFWKYLLLCSTDERNTFEFVTWGENPSCLLTHSFTWKLKLLLSFHFLNLSSKVVFILLVYFSIHFGFVGFYGFYNIVNVGPVNFNIAIFTMHQVRGFTVQSTERISFMHNIWTI